MEKVLKGHRVLITRSMRVEYTRLEEQGALLVVLPTIAVAPPQSLDDLDWAIRDIRKYNWLLFTSRNGVHAFLRRFLELNGEIRDLGGLRLCAVGSGTAEVLKTYGLRAELVPEHFSAEGLVAAFSRAGGITDHPGGYSFLFPRAESANDTFIRKVREWGGAIDAPVAYRTVVPHVPTDDIASLLHSGITIATFTSGSTFTNFQNMVGADATPFLSRTAIAVIGPVTRRQIEKAGLHVAIMPTRATIGDMVEAIITWAGGKDL